MTVDRNSSEYRIAYAAFAACLSIVLIISTLRPAEGWMETANTVVRFFAAIPVLVAMFRLLPVLTGKTETK